MLGAAFGEGLRIPKRRPRRKILARLRSTYQFIIFAGTILIACISLPGEWAAGAVVLYLAYYVFKYLIKLRLGEKYNSGKVQFTRAMCLVGALWIFLGCLIGFTDYVLNYNNPAGRGNYHNLWLLFLLAIFMVSQTPNTLLMAATTIISGIAIVILEGLAIYRINKAVSFDLLSLLTDTLEASLIKLVWLVLLAFILHTMLRSIAEWYSDLQLLQYIEAAIRSDNAAMDEVKLLHEIVTRIATEFDYHHVNIFYVGPGNKLSCVTGASSSGLALRKSGFSIEIGQGIIGWVAQNARPLMENDVSESRSPYYYHGSFPHTKAEMALPIQLDGRVLGVLDIQSHHKNVFLEKDCDLMMIMTSNLARLLDNWRTRESSRLLNKIVENIATRLLLQPALEKTIQELANVALKEFKADVVTIYERDPSTNQVTNLAYAGQLYHEREIQKVVVRPDGLVNRLLATPDDYFQDCKALQAVASSLLFRPSDYHLKTSTPTFVEREQIRARAILHLSTGPDCIGLMCLNFRTDRTFSQDDQQALRTFANLAALALQKAQYLRREKESKEEETRLEIERRIQSAHEEMARRLHDQLNATANGAYWIVDTVIEEGDLSPRSQVQLETARRAMETLLGDISYLKGSVENFGYGDFYTEMNHIINLAKTAYDVEVEQQIVGTMPHLSQEIVENLKAVLHEAIMNSVRHGRTKKIELTLIANCNQLYLQFRDYGRGFDQQSVKPRGMLNIRKRIEEMRGICEIQSEVGEGTCLKLTVPV